MDIYDGAEGSYAENKPTGVNRRRPRLSSSGCTQT